MSGDLRSEITELTVERDLLRGQVAAHELIEALRVHPCTGAAWSTTGASGGVQYGYQPCSQCERLRLAHRALAELKKESA